MTNINKLPIVIVVEDELIQQEMITEVLGDVAHVVPAFTLLAAWNAFQQADKSRLAMFLVDGSVPAGRGGPEWSGARPWDLVTLIRGAHWDGDIVTISGNTDSQAKIKAAGANIDLPKPFRLDSVIQLIEDWRAGIPDGG